LPSPKSISISIASTATPGRFISTKSIIQSKITCNPPNCVLENACFDAGDSRVKSLRIRLFGNATALWASLPHSHTGVREENIIKDGIENVQHASRIPDFIDSESTAAVAVRWVKKNCGHDLGDNAVAFFRIMRLFPTNAAQQQRLSRLFVVGLPDVCDKIFTLMTDSIVNVHYKKSRYKPRAKLECFARVYFGLRSVSYMIDGGQWTHREKSLESDLKAFRDMSYNNAGVNISTTKLDTLLIMEKRKGKHFTNLGNLTELTGYLRREFSNYHVVRVTWSDYGVKEQVQLMSRTRAMISLPGSDVMNGIFLQDNCSVVMYCRNMGGKYGHDISNERTLWFDKVSYVDASTEDCNSTNIWYSKGEVLTEGVSYTYIDFDSLKVRLEGLGIAASHSSSA
jgi:hypothetical protein